MFKKFWFVSLDKMAQKLEEPPDEKGEQKDGEVSSDQSQKGKED